MRYTSCYVEIEGFADWDADYIEPTLVKEAIESDYKYVVIQFSGHSKRYTYLNKTGLRKLDYDHYKGEWVKVPGVCNGSHAYIVDLTDDSEYPNITKEINENFFTDKVEYRESRQVSSFNPPGYDPETGMVSINGHEFYW